VARPADDPAEPQFHALLPDVPLHNLYGPTEAAVEVSYWQCRPAVGDRSDERLLASQR